MRWCFFIRFVKKVFGIISCLSNFPGLKRLNKIKKTKTKTKSKKQKTKKQKNKKHKQKFQNLLSLYDNHFASSSNQTLIYFFAFY